MIFSTTYFSLCRGSVYNVIYLFTLNGNIFQNDNLSEGFVEISINLNYQINETHHSIQYLIYHFQNNEQILMFAFENHKYHSLLIMDLYN